MGFGIWKQFPALEEQDGYGQKNGKDILKALDGIISFWYNMYYTNCSAAINCKKTSPNVSYEDGQVTGDQH